MAAGVKIRPLFAALSAIVGCALLAPLAAAQSGTAPLPPILAFAAVDVRGKAPHKACHASTPQAARDCALSKCRSDGSRDCRIAASCFPAYWSASLSVSLQGANRTTLVVCGMPSRPGLIARMKDVCRTYRPRGLESCTLETVWTPAGEEETAGLRWTRQSLRTPVSR